jgi:hypothetical protein
MESSPEERPPFFKTWKAWYGLVIGFLFFLLVCFYFFTKHFS